VGEGKATVSRVQPGLPVSSFTVASFNQRISILICLDMLVFHEIFQAKEKAKREHKKYQF
jgi:hypothetical protein